jgi:hypothetical protein
MPEGQRPKPWSSLRRGGAKHDTANHDAIREHIVVVIAIRRTGEKPTRV